MPTVSETSNRDLAHEFAISVLRECRMESCREPVAWLILHHAVMYLEATRTIEWLSLEDWHALCGNVQPGSQLFWNELPREPVSERAGERALQREVRVAPEEDEMRKEGW